ncbi:Ig domain-containing protein [Dysosmobacter sp.]
MRKTTNKLLALLLTLVMVLGLLPITAFAAGEVQISQVSDKSVSAEDDSVGLPHAVIGQPYSVQFTAAGGTAPYTWDYALAYLPEGLTLDPATGVLSGTPTAAYSGTPTIVVEDSNNNYDSIGPV